MKSIGLTGGIGSGKTTVAGIFEQSGYRVYYADVRSKALLSEDEAVKAAVTALLGPAAYTADGLADRAYIAGIVFADKAKLAALNAITHPAVAKDHARWLAEIPASYGKPFVLKEAAILFEAGTDHAADAVISVYAPKSLRIARVCARDQSTPAAVRDRIRNQWPDFEKMRRSDFVIYNDGIHHLIPQVLAATRHFEARWQ